jgi:putative alpha-1,2-mannosidase
MKVEVDFDKIFKQAIETGANEHDYSFHFWDAFNELYPEVTQKYADMLEKLEEKANDGDAMIDYVKQINKDIREGKV